MKLIAFAISILFCFQSLGQDELSINEGKTRRGVIKVRKFRFDTMTSVNTEMDSMCSGWETVLAPEIHSKPRYKGYLTDYILLRSGNLYVFNTPISSRDKKRTFAKRKSKGFWNKIRRQKKRGKLHYFKVKCEREWVDSSFNQFFNDYKVSELYYPETDILAETIETKIDSSLDIRTRTDNFARYTIFNDTYYIPKSNGVGLNGCFNNNCFTEYLGVLLSDSVNSDQFLLTLTCPKTINRNTYEFEFDLKKSGSNTVKITKNGTETFICNYRIRNKKLFIENPPIPEFAKGKVNSRINRIRFKVHSTTHEYNMN